MHNHTPPSISMEYQFLSRYSPSPKDSGISFPGHSDLWNINLINFLFVQAGLVTVKQKNFHREKIGKEVTMLYGILRKII